MTSTDPLAGEGEIGRLLIGTSGYSYEDWIGSLYPPGTTKRRFLRLYAAEFPLVELNFSYYTQPAPETLARMAQETPQSFLFAVKAHRSLTHEINNDLSGVVTTFKNGIAPLVEAGRLAAVLFQFPYSFHYTPPARMHLERLCESFAGLPLAVEFRNDEWQRDSVYAGLRARSAAYVNVDEPALPRLPRPTELVTSSLGYVRFHGRNRGNWWHGDNVTRYDYLYDRRELTDWLPAIERMLTQAKLVLAIFNNHSRGQAVHNARDLRALLSAPA